MITLKDVRVGSIVLVCGDFGNAPPMSAIVEEVDEDIKNGRPGICYADSWAYLTQIKKVVKF